MSGTLPEPEEAVAMICGLPDEDLEPFVRESIAERRLSSLMRSLNEAIAAGDPGLRDSAEGALRRLGFL